MHYYNLVTKEVITSETAPQGDWVILPKQPSILCYLADDLTWQPPLPKQDDMYDWDFINLTWVKR